jgi:hypothetical protein
MYVPRSTRPVADDRKVYEAHGGLIAPRSQQKIFTASKDEVAAVLKDVSALFLKLSRPSSRSFCRSVKTEMISSPLIFSMGRSCG